MNQNPRDDSNRIYDGLIDFVPLQLPKLRTRTTTEIILGSGTHITKGIISNGFLDFVPLKLPMFRHHVFPEHVLPAATLCVPLFRYKGGYINVINTMLNAQVQKSLIFKLAHRYFPKVHDDEKIECIDFNNKSLGYVHLYRPDHII